MNASNPDYLSINYQYDAAGRLLSRVMSSGARSLYSYDNGGWMNRLQHFDAVGASLANTTYMRDRLGHIISQTDASGTTASGLDALYRLIQIDGPGSANDEAFSYDRIGNRLIATRGSTTVGATGAGITSKYSIYNPATQTGTVTGYTPTDNNRLKEVRIGSTTGSIDSSFTFDNEGRLTRQTGTGARTLTWEPNNRLATLNNGSSTETYGYDPLDHRIQRTGGALGSRDYYLEGDHLESVYSGSQLQEKYFRGATIDELVAGYTMQGGTLTPYLFQHDAVMSVSATSNPNGGTQSTQKFWAFGETQATTGTPVTRLKYTGREDDGTGLYQYRARYYDPSLGRFISEDPLKFQAGVNFYAYVSNDPLDSNDPSGHFENLTVSGNTVNINIPIAFQGANATPAAISAYSKQIAGAWSGTFGNYNVTTSVTTPAVGTPRGQYNVVEIGPLNPDVAGGQPFTNAVGGSYMKVGPLSGDQKVDAYNLWTAGHEAGHAMGLVDMYIGEGTALPQYGDNIMGAYRGVPEQQDISNIIYLKSIGLDAGHTGYPAPAIGSAAGEFVIYPNKSTTNQIRSVYAK